MNISILTLFPRLYESFLTASLMGRAQENGYVQYHVENFFSYAAPKERIDSPTCGHGAGVLLRPDIVDKAITAQEQLHGTAYRVFFSPHGKKLDQPLLKKIYENVRERRHLLLVTSRYEGMDARIEEYYADSIVSVGDFVLMGGDVPAMMLLEGLLRLVPGVVGKQESVERESFSGPFVDHPEYTAPVVWKGMEVPEVLRSGNHKHIEQWRSNQAAQRTVLRHFEWLRSHVATPDQEVLAKKYIPAHYAALMHAQVVVPHVGEGTTSITSLDIHDIARSSTTYGLSGYFIVTPLEDQKRIACRLLEFWHTGVGIEYNRQRHEALKHTMITDSLDEVRAAIEKHEGVEPLLIATSAQPQHGSMVEPITYYDQEKVWNLKRPVLFLFGTGRGLAPRLLEQCDFILPPLRGFSDFNHLSVRSAAAIVMDRWLGINPK